MTIASGEISLQSKLNIICHVTEVKAATSAHSVAEVIPFFSVFNIRFESNVSIKPKENIFYTQKIYPYIHVSICLYHEQRMSKVVTQVTKTLVVT